YSFVRDYLLLDDIGEYCALNLRGDCGLQAILFITLCRICSIPARWQSGLEYSGDSVGSHDWAQFYLPGWGWLFADCSYGGGAFRAGSALRHAFYFGNIDPARMAANRRFMAELTPNMQTIRRDPCDNQTGEMERVGDSLPLQPYEYERNVELTEYTVLS
ncbi:MAG: transglutaminase domain-containing protein, partial [Clostridia bacterium]|nr:transglutaminase domain-containing protein [Clostridia bacterium]